MIQTSIGSTRRILTLPAVQPDDSVSPATLLDSLIGLGHKIRSYKNEFYGANRRNVREMIREIEVLVVLLEETRNWSTDLSGSAVLGLSELHVAFQKVRYLLGDCAKEGARVWMLVKSERVLNHIRVLGRAIRTSLEVLPRGSIGRSGEAEEMIELVLKQTRKSSFEIDGVDKRVLEEVNSILNRFGNLVEPDLTGLRRVLGFLGIESGSDCNKEVRFLESELNLESSTDDKSESVVLSSLIGLVTYSRCVLFDFAAGEPCRQSNSVEPEAGPLNFINPEDFNCPISLQFMSDPVTISTGHTYDRSSIEKWFRSGNPICPKTGERLKNTDLVPNLALRSLIHQYHPITETDLRNRDVTMTSLPGSPAAAGAIKMAASFLASRLRSGPEQERSKPAHEVRILAKASIFNRFCLVESGLIPDLLDLLSSTVPSTQETAIAALLNLSKHPKARVAIIESNGLDPIVGLIRNGLKVESCHHAAATLFYLASDKEHSKLIGEIQETIPGLLTLVEQGSNRGKKNSISALLRLLSHPLNHSKVLKTDTVPLLINLIKIEDQDSILQSCLSVLASLSQNPDGSIAVLRHGGLNSIMEVLSSSSTSNSCKEHSASILLALCVNGGSNVIALLGKSPLLMASLYSLLSDGSPRASRKATALIRVLHQYFERRSSLGPVRRVLAQDRAVHVW